MSKLERYAERFLVVYSALLTIALGAIVLGGARTVKKSVFDEINVGRINVLEPDGTLSMVISNKASFPGVYVHGKDTPHPDRRANGMLFIDDEGTEIGGLIYGGSTDETGKIQGHGHLSFDRYNGDQLLSIDNSQEGREFYTGLKINDEALYSMENFSKEAARIETLPKDVQEAAWRKFRHDFPHPNRVLLARTADKVAVLKLRDEEGRDRLVLRVAADGNPSVELLDAAGKVVSHLP